MKISFNWPLGEGNNGPSFFLNRLAVHLATKGVKIVPPEQADVYLVFVSDNVSRIESLKRRGVKVIQRLDGIYFDSQNTLGNTYSLNMPIKATYDVVDAVVFQSAFSKKLIENHFGAKEKNDVIHNGIDLKETKKDDRDIIVCSSSWRRHKRLKEIHEIFFQMDKRFKLVVFGKPDYQVDDPRVSYISAKSFESVRSYYLNATAFIHLCWFDSCPNAVVEALSVGLPVVCGNQGGTRELVEMTDGGFVANTDSSFDYGMVDLYNPPPIMSTQEIVNVISSKSFAEIDRRPIDIAYVAQKYINFIESILT